MLQVLLENEILQKNGIPTHAPKSVLNMQSMVQVLGVNMYITYLIQPRKCYNAVTHTQARTRAHRWNAGYGGACLQVLLTQKWHSWQHLHVIVLVTIFYYARVN